MQLMIMYELCISHLTTHSAISRGLQKPLQVFAHYLMESLGSKTVCRSIPPTHTVSYLQMWQL